jgi:hypothetical protein
MAAWRPRHKRKQGRGTKGNRAEACKVGRPRAKRIGFRGC